MVMQRIESNIAISVSDLKKNPSAVFDQSGGAPVAVLNHNRVMGYMVPAALYEAMMERLDDEELIRIARERMGEPSYPVALDDL
jgi:antitoxin StbD